MENVIWKDIKDYEGMYQVSNTGLVRSLDRYTPDKGELRLQKGKILKQRHNKKGYMVVSLSDQVHRNSKTRSVHRLVAIAFIDNPQNKLQVNHIDGNKENNNVNNLEWCTNAENNKHAWNNGLMRHDKTEEKLRKEIQVLDEDCNVIKTYRSVTDAANDVGTSTTNIAKAAKTWVTTAGYYWRYTSRKMREKCYKSIIEYRKNITHKRCINQIDLKGNKIATYDSISYAHRVTGACNISLCLTNERKTSGGYRWEYASEEDMKEMFRKRLFDFIGEPK